MTDDDNRNETGTLQNESTDSIQPLQKSKPGSSVLPWISTGISVLVLGSVLWSLVGRFGGPAADEELVIEGRTAKAAGNVQAATDSFNAVLAMPDASETWQGVAEYELARQAYDRSEYAEASAALSKVLAKQILPTEERLQSLLLRIICAEKLGDFSNVHNDADAILATADVTEEFQARALMMRAMALSDAGEFDAAIADETRGLALAKGLSNIEGTLQNNRGANFEALGRTEEAISDFSAVIEGGSADVDTLGLAYNNRGLVHRKAGRFDAAIADATSALELEGASAETQQRARGDLAASYSERGLENAAAGDLEAAIFDDTAGMEMADGDIESQSQIQYNRALHYSQLDRIEEALNDYSSVIKRGSPNTMVVARAYYHRGVIRKDAGNHQDAISDFRASLDLPDTSVAVRVDCLNKLCSVYEDQKDFENAFANAAEICEIEGLSQTQSALGLFLRGFFAFQLGKLEKAKDDLATARDLAVKENLAGIVKIIDELVPQLSPAATEEVTQ